MTRSAANGEPGSTLTRMSPAHATVIFVLDYPAMGRPGSPRCLHRTDCPHPLATALWRKATAQELADLPECRDCQHREAQDGS